MSTKILESVEVDDNFSVISYTFKTSLGQENPYIPNLIVCDTKSKTTIVTWPDGQTTQVTCSKDDRFSIEFGYYSALAIYANGNHKQEFKDFIVPRISRKVLLDGNGIEPMPYGKKWKNRRNKSRKLSDKIKFLQSEIDRAEKEISKMRK